MMPKMPALAPIPSPSTPMAVREKPGCFRRRRALYRRSFHKSCMTEKRQFGRDVNKFPAFLRYVLKACKNVVRCLTGSICVVHICDTHNRGVYSMDKRRL